MSDSHYISLNEAAELTGRAKSTISKALKNGKMSYVAKDPETGQYMIDPAEAFRVFPKKHETDESHQIETHGKPHGNSVLAAELQALKDRLAMLESERDRERSQLTDQIEDLRRRLDGVEAARQRLTAQLTDQRENAPEPRRAGFWARLIGQA